MNKQQLTQELGLLIKRYRENYMLTQEELSFRANIHRNQISLIERGMSDPKTTTLMTLCKILNIPGRELEKLSDALTVTENL